MLGTNGYYYKDKYMFFNFNGISSEKYNLFIVNNNELTIENNIAAQSSFSNAYLQEGTYYLGTTSSQKIFKRTCASEGLNFEQYKEMIQWLAPGTQGQLSFCSDPFWGWDVVVDNVADAKFNGSTENMIVQFEVTFKTIGSHCAHNVFPTIWETINYTNDNPSEAQVLASVASASSYRIPAIVVKATNTKIKLYIQNICNKYQIFKIWANITGNDAKNITLYDDDSDDSTTPTVYLDAEFGSNSAGNFEYDSKTGTFLFDSNLAENSPKCKKVKEKNGLIKIPSKSPKLYNDITWSYSTNTLTVNLGEHYTEIITSYKFDYAVLIKKSCTGTRYGGNNPYSLTGNNYTTDNVSYFGFLTFKPGSNTWTASNSNITMTTTIAPEEGAEYYLFCGYSKKFVIETSAGTINDANVEVISYNNM